MPRGSRSGTMTCRHLQDRRVYHTTTALLASIPTPVRGRLLVATRLNPPQRKRSLPCTSLRQRIYGAQMRRLFLLVCDSICYMQAPTVHVLVVCLTG